MDKIKDVIKYFLCNRKRRRLAVVDEPVPHVISYHGFIFYMKNIIEFQGLKL